MTIWVGEINQTPLGVMWVAYSPDGVVSLRFAGDVGSFLYAVEELTGGDTAVYAPAQIQPVATQLQEYFHGQRTDFALPLRWDILTPFQQQVLPLVHAIPYGQTRTYGDIATSLGGIGQARAVGRANATNPLPILIPCHRVLGGDGKLHGYAGGLERKAWLLRLEGRWLL